MAENATLPPAGAPPYDAGMEARVALLEQAVISIDRSLGDIRQDLREMRQDARETRQELHQGFADVRKEMHQGFTDIRQEQKTDTRWLLTLGLAATAFVLAAIAGLFALMAHGFHWY